MPDASRANTLRRRWRSTRVPPLRAPRLDLDELARRKSFTCPLFRVLSDPIFPCPGRISRIRLPARLTSNPSAASARPPPDPSPPHKAQPPPAYYERLFEDRSDRRQHPLPGRRVFGDRGDPRRGGTTNAGPGHSESSLDRRFELLSRIAEFPHCRSPVPADSGSVGLGGESSSLGVITSWSRSSVSDGLGAGGSPPGPSCA